MKKVVLFCIMILIPTLFCIRDVKNISAEEKKAPACLNSFPGMACIPAGEFIRGSNKHGADERPEAKVYVSEFYMDINEVTNEEFNKCLAEGKCKECLKNKTCTYVGAKYGKRYQGPKQPVSGISWFTAKEYCEWAGKRLPTEAEWEKAARGTDGDIYPWGNEEADCKRAVIMDRQGRKGCAPKKLSPDWHMPTQDVASRPAGKYGLYDMAGNSWEWVSDWYAPYTKCGDACLGRDPKGPCGGADKCPGYSHKVLKSGSWWWSAYYARSSNRRHNDPGFKEQYHHFGFRCAKDPQKIVQ